MKNTLIISAWFSGVAMTMFVSFITLHTFTQTQELPALFQNQYSNQGNNKGQLSLARISGAVKGINTTIQTGDARPVLIAQFLEKHESPLKPYDYWGKTLTEIADKYNLDFRLLPSIAMQESNLCRVIPEGTYNCLGLGIHAQGTWGFPSFESNFDKAAEILRENYLDKGYITPDEIQDKYTPYSNGSWEFAVNHFMEKLETAEF
ncbi:hypothetical protein ACFL1M_01550 [Patescibacteria group bacterium]